MKAQVTEGEIKGWTRLMGHDVLALFGGLHSAESMEYVKLALCEAYPELAQLTPTTSEEWLTEAAILLKIKPEILIKEIEKQILRSYLIDKAYKDICETLVDQKVPLIKKELLVGTMLRHKIYARQLRLLLTGLFTAVWATAFVYAVANVIVFLPSLLFPDFRPLMMFIATPLGASVFYFKFHDKVIAKAFAEMLKN